MELEVWPAGIDQAPALLLPAGDLALFPQPGGLEPDVCGSKAWASPTLGREVRRPLLVWAVTARESWTQGEGLSSGA